MIVCKSHSLYGDYGNPNRLTIESHAQLGELGLFGSTWGISIRGAPMNVPCKEQEDDTEGTTELPQVVDESESDTPEVHTEDVGTDPSTEDTNESASDVEVCESTAPLIQFIEVEYT